MVAKKQQALHSNAAQKIPRPHSVDFLEYETKNPISPNLSVNLTNRPKSSLDINSTPDNYFYSEASYAEKMRQSINYLPRSKISGNTTKYQQEGNHFYFFLSKF